MHVVIASWACLVSMYFYLVSMFYNSTLLKFIKATNFIKATKNYKGYKNS